MSPKFWLLEPPSLQPQAEVSPDTKYEPITCPIRGDAHRRGGRRVGDISAVVDPAAVRDFTWAWGGDILVSLATLSLFEKHRVTGFETRRTQISYPKAIDAKPPDLFELIVTGWGGLAAAAAGVSLARYCPGCGHKVYAIAEPSRLIDPGTWDGSDLFIVWPLPRFRFASDRLAAIIRQEGMSGVDLIPAPDIPTDRGVHVTPGTLAMHMPEDRARKLAGSLGI